MLTLWLFRIGSSCVVDMDESELEKITGACKNVQLSAVVPFSKDLYPTLKVLGHQLEKC